MKARLYLLVQVAVTGVLLWMLFRGFDRASFAALFGRLPLWFYVTSLVAVLAGQLLYAWRWQVVLRALGVALPFRRVLEQCLISTFVSNFLPSTVGGDLAKVYYLGRAHGYGPISSSVVLDRLLGVGILAALTSGVLLAFPLETPGPQGVRLGVMAIALGVVVGLAVVLAGTGGLAKRASAFGPRVVRVAELMQRLRVDIARTVTSPRVLATVFAVALMYFLLLGVVYEAFIGLQTGERPAFLPLVTAIAATAVLSNFPVSFNGLGLREHLHVAQLAPLGVPGEVAVGISLLLFAHLLVLSLFGGICWMRMPAPGPAGRNDLSA